MDSTSSGPEPATSRLSAGLVALAWVTQFLVGTDLFVVAPLLPDIAASLHVAPASTGLLITAFSLAYVVASPFAGWLSDRYDRARILAGGLVLFSLANVATALAPSFGLLLATRVVAGVAAAATGPTVYALVSTRAQVTARAQVLAVVGSGLLTALWVGAPAGALLSRHTGWRAAFVILAVGTCVLAVPHAFVWRSGPTPAPAAGSPAAGSGAAGSTPDAGEALVGKPVPGGQRGAGTAAFAVAVTALWAFSAYSLYTFLAVALHADGRAADVSWLLVAYGIAAVVGGQAGGRLADRAGAVRVTGTALALMAAAETAVALVLPFTWALAVALALFALVAYAFFPAQQRHLVDTFPERATGMLSWNNSALFIGLSLAGAIGGPVVHAYGYPQLLYLGAAVAVPACLLTRRRPGGRRPSRPGHWPPDPTGPARSY
ncbi:MFS transporter [Streptomyces sp. NPDC046831]|uniref:MFS transporter n=1 Tax=Streptomyces sp. NPDC046831 TaxID=3154805 RepID=UPI0033F642B8